MAIQRRARGVRIPTPGGTVIGRLRGQGDAQPIAIADIAREIASAGVIPSVPAPTVVAAGTGIGVSYSAPTYTVSNSGVLSITAPAAGFTVNAATGAVTFTLANDLAALEALSSAGMAARTGTSTWATRTITGPAAGITVSNGDGVSGNPTFALANDLSALEGLGSTGLAARTATDTWAQRTITGTSARLSVSNGDGVSGNPTLDIDAAYVGQSSITTLGTIGSGTWAGTTIAVNHGGTGQTSYTDGQLLIGNSSGNTLSKATLTPGANISITNGAGAITVALSGSPALTGTPTAPTAAAGTNTTQIATTAFVETEVANAIADFDLKNPVVAATTAALPFSPTYANGASGVGATLTGGVGILAFDGYTPVLNDRVLIKNQGSSFQNGVYTVTTVGTVVIGYVLTRATDFNQTANILYGDTVGVLQGTVNANQQFTMNNNTAITVGTTAITFAQTSGGSQLTAGTGITITGNSVALTTPVSPANGGTGVANNAASTITISGAFGTTFTVSATTSCTLPSGTHTLAGLDVAQTWTAAQTFNFGADNTLALDKGSVLTTYNIVSLNGTKTLAGGLGLLGGATADANLNFLSPTGGGYIFFVNGVQVAKIASGGLTLNGSTSGTLIVKPPAAAGSNTLTLPAGTTDFSATGGASQVVKQTSAGGALTVARLAETDLTNGVDWTTEAPTVTSGTGTFTTVSCTQKFHRVGSIVHVIGSVTMTTVGTAGGAIKVPWPTTASAGSLGGSVFATAEMSSGAAAVGSGTGGNIEFLKYDGTTAINGNGSTITYSYFYQTS